MTDSSKIASQMASLRWAKTTPEERSAVAVELNAAKKRLKAAAEKTATLRTQSAKRRSKKPSSPIKP